MSERRHVLTDAERSKGARRTNSNPEVRANAEATLRRWHVENGHEVEDATPEERAIIDAFRRSLHGSR